MMIRVDLDLFDGMVKLCNFSFSKEKVREKGFFPETIAACGLKVGRYRQLIEQMNVYEY